MMVKGVKGRTVKGRIGWGLVALMALLGLMADHLPRAHAEPQDVSANALRNGGFELDENQDGQTDSWTTEGRVSRTNKPTPGEGHWALMLLGTDAGGPAVATQTVHIPQPAPSIATVSCLLRSNDLAPVGKGGGAAELTVEFLDAKGQPLRKPKELGTWSKPVGWRPWTGLIRLPEGAASLRLRIALDGVAGQVMFDDVRLLWGLPDDEDRENLLVDGGFEYYSPWSPWVLPDGQKTAFPGHTGHALLKLYGDAQPVVISQAFTLPSRPDGDLQLSMDVRGGQTGSDGPGLHAEIAWQDANGKECAPQRLFDPTVPTKSWKTLTHAVRVPEDATAGTLRLVFDSAQDVAMIDNVRLTGRAADGPMQRPASSVTDTRGWHRFEAVDGPLGAALDASDLLDPPAGRHGFLTVDNGRFLFEDGTPVRFFGVNLDGKPALVPHEQAEALARRLAQMGCNMVRLHHLDAPNVSPNLFDPNFDDTQHLSAESVDRVDYLIAQLKARGIYIYLDLLTSRVFRRGDGVEAARQLAKGAKTASMFDPRIIELQQQYARSLLTHVNPYTKLRWADEPTIALMEVVNESTLLVPKRLEAMPQAYKDQLRRRWIDSLRALGREPSPEDRERYLQVDEPDVQQWYGQLQLYYFLQMRAFLRQLGLRIPLAGSNLAKPDPSGQDLQTNAAMDFIDRHAYWDPPRSGVGDLTRFHNRLLIEDTSGEQPLIRLSRLRVAGKPFVASEWNVDWPNEYRAAGPLLMAAYGLFQEWNGLLQFSDNGELRPTVIQSNFDISTKPELFWQFPVAARLFQRRDVEPARERAVYSVAPEPSIPDAMPLVHGVRRRWGDDVSSPIPALGGKPWISDTGQLTWDPDAGLATIDTFRTQAVIGRTGGAPKQLSTATVQTSTPFASIALTSLDQAPLAESRHMLLVTVARSENAGTVYNATRTMLRSPGHAPILLEPVVGTLTLPLAGRKAPRVFALDAAGARGKAIDVRVEQDHFELPLGEAPLYEIVFDTTS